MRTQISIFLAAVMAALTINNIFCQASEPPISMYAQSAALIDGENNRLLYGLKEHEPRAMASTTKIMTLIIALEYGDMEQTVTISPYAASQPDVQLNSKAGEQYKLKDMLYMMMLQSYNDIAMAVAENIGQSMFGELDEAEVIAHRSYDESREYVALFVDAMNAKAETLGCVNTYFVTPNGLDAADENGSHRSTAYELAVIAAYALKVPRLTDITTTRNYSCNELNGKRNVSINTTDRFLDMCNGAVGLKTGFTGAAGYCFVGAIKQEGRTFVSVVLGSGWPPNKNYKWTDTKKLMNYGTANFFPEVIFESISEYRNIEIINGQNNIVATEIPGNVRLLLTEGEDVQVIYKMPEKVTAPVAAGQQIGTVYIYINGSIYTTLPIVSKADIEKVNYLWFLHKIIRFFVI